MAHPGLLDRHRGGTGRDAGVSTLEERPQVPPARASRTRRRVLDATAELLAEGGLPAVTIDAIRDRSGVSKTTIYKHWPNRVFVAVDAFDEQLAVAAVATDTGSFRTDVTEQFDRVIAFYASPVGRVLTQLLAQALYDPDVAAQLGERLQVSRWAGIEELWDRAVARGEVRAGVAPDLAMDVVFGPVMWRLLSGRPPYRQNDAASIADAILRGLLVP